MIETIKVQPGEHKAMYLDTPVMLHPRPAAYPGEESYTYIVTRRGYIDAVHMGHDLPIDRVIRDVIRDLDGLDTSYPPFDLTIWRGERVLALVRMEHAGDAWAPNVTRFDQP